MLLLVAGMVVGCGQASSSPSSSTASEGPSQAPTTTASASAATGPSGSYDVGDGRMLYLECIGEGSPTIVIDVGNDDTIHGSWGAVFAPMGEISQTCAYDRANLGRSGPDPGPRTIADLGDDLLVLLDVAGVEGPYVFVGGSYGGNIVGTLAARHPEAVAGLVFVDSEPAHLLEENPLRLNLSDEQLDACCGDFWRTASSTPSAFGLPAWDSADNLEHIDFTGGFDEELATVGNQPQVPAVVLTATRIDCDPAWPCDAIREDATALQARWIEGNPLGEQVLIESGHVVQRELPSAIIDHTRTVVESVRSD